MIPAVDRRLFLLPGIVLGVTVIGSFLLWNRERALGERSAEARIEYEIERTRTLIEARVDAYEQALRGAAGMVRAEDQLSRRQWQAFAGALEADSNLPGFYGIGFAPHVSRGEEAAFTVSAENLGVPSTTIHPGGERDFYLPVLFIEPESRNAAAIGFDLASEPIRREAIEWARDTGLPALTSRIRLVQEPGSQAGLLFLVPVYRRGTVPSEQALRRTAFAGVVYAPIRVGQMMEGVLGGHARPFELRLYDGPGTAQPDLMFETTGAGDRADATAWQTLPFPIAGRTWTVAFASSLELTRGREWRGLIFLAACLAASALLAGLTWSLAWSRSRSLGLVDQMTAKVRLQGAQIQDLVDNATDLIQSVSPEGEIVFANRAWKRTLGYSDEDLAGLSMFDVLHEEGREHCLEAFRTLLAGGAVDRVDAIFRAKDGRKVIVEGSANCRFENGVPVATRGIFRDITERRKAEASLREREAVFRRVLETAIDGVILFDDRGRVILANAAADLMFGVDPGRLVGLDARELLGSRSENEIDRLFHYLADQPPGSFAGTRRHLAASRRNGGEFPVHVSLSEIASDDRRVIAAFVRDETNQKKAEADLARARDAALEASRLKSEFLANMSHELRTPLNSIIGFSELLLDRVPGPLNDRQDHAVTDVVESGRHLLKLINDLLDLAKIEAGRMEVAPHEVDVRNAVRAAAAMVAPLAEKKSLAITEVADGGGMVLANEGRLHQILINLLSNAVKFTPEGGRIEIRATVSGPNPHFTEISVTDTGIGIRPEDQELIFEEFRQVDGSHSRRFEGTGLGLALCRKLVVLMAGTISVVSEPGRGSTFTVTLPRANSDDSEEGNRT